MKISAHYEVVFPCLIILMALGIGYIDQMFPGYLSNIEKCAACLICVVFITSNIIKLYRLWKTERTTH